MIRLFTFRAFGDDVVTPGRSFIEASEGGAAGEFGRKLEFYTAEGWRPIHWQDASTSDHLQFHVVMERDEDK